MEKTSLEQFDWIIDTQYPELKKYIVSKNEHQVILEDHMGDMVFGSNEEISVLFKHPNEFPSIKNKSVSYREKDSLFVITLQFK